MAIQYRARPIFLVVNNGMYRTRMHQDHEFRRERQRARQFGFRGTRSRLRIWWRDGRAHPMNSARLSSARETASVACWSSWGSIPGRFRRGRPWVGWARVHWRGRSAFLEAAALPAQLLIVLVELWSRQRAAGPDDL